MKTSELRAAAKVVYYLDTDERVADNLSELLNNAADKIEELENEKDSYHKEYQKGFEDGRIERKSNDSAHAFNRGYLKGLEKSKDDVEKAVIEKDNIYNEGFEDGRVYGYKKGKGESKFNPTEWISTVSKGYYDKGFNKGMLEGHAKGFKKGINYGKI